MMDWTSEAAARQRRTVMEEGTRQRGADFKTFSRKINNLSFRKQMNVRPYEPPSARSFGTPDTPSQFRIAINKYPLNAKYKAIGMRALRESGLPLISMLNTRPNAQVPEVQFDSAYVLPEILATAELRPASLWKSAKVAKALYERVGPCICNTLRCISQSPVSRQGCVESKIHRNRN